MLLVTEMADELIVEQEEDITEQTEFEDASERSAEPDELEVMRGELEALRAELSRRDAIEREREHADAEFSRFREYFPKTSPEEIPKEVWEAVKNGESLAGAYSLHLRRGELERERIGEFNKKTRRMSAGSLNCDRDDKYFSPAEVRKMSAAQVKQHYDDIIESMRHWN